MIYKARVVNLNLKDNSIDTVPLEVPGDDGKLERFTMDVESVKDVTNFIVKNGKEMLKQYSGIYDNFMIEFIPIPEKGIQKIIRSSCVVRSAELDAIRDKDVGSSVIMCELLGNMSKMLDLLPYRIRISPNNDKDLDTFRMTSELYMVPRKGNPVVEIEDE